MNRLSRAALAAPLLAVTLLLSGCSSAVPQSDLEDEVGRDVEGVSDVACDGDLEGEVDATQTCTITYEDDSSIDVEVTATEVDGDTINFDVAEVTE